MHIFILLLFIKYRLFVDFHCIRTVFMPSNVGEMIDDFKIIMFKCQHQNRFFVHQQTQQEIMKEDCTSFGRNDRYREGKPVLQFRTILIKMIY